MEAGAWGAGANRSNGDGHIQLTTSYAPRRSFCPRSRKDPKAGGHSLPLLEQGTGRPGRDVFGRHTVGVA